MESGRSFKKDAFFDIFEKMRESVYIVEALRDERDIIVDLRIEYANPASPAHSNVLRENLIGKKFSLVHGPEITKSYIKIINEIQITGEDSKGEIYYPIMDKYFLISAFSFQNNLYMIINADISQEKKTEEELKEKETFLKNIFRTYPGVIWVYDLLNEENVYICREIYELIGYTKEEMQGKEKSFWKGLYHPDDLEKAENFLEKIQNAKNGEVIELEYRLKHKNEEWHWFNAKHVIFKRNPEGKPWQFLGIVEDITEHKRTEELLRFSERTFRTLAENSPDIIIRFNHRLNITYVNPVFPRLMGKKREELVGKSFQDPEMPYEFISSSEKLLNEVFENKKPETLEFNLQTLEGLKYYSARIIPEFERSYIETILFVAHDISDIKQAEEALQESEEKFSEAFHANPMAMTLSDDEGRWLEVNESFINLTGYDRDELIGKTSAELNLINTKKREQTLTELREKGSMQDIEFEMQTKSGEKRVIISSSERIELGGEIRFISFIYDITERNQAEEEIRRLADIVENSEDAIIGKTVDGTIFSWNKGAEKIYGYKADEIIGKHISILMNDKEWEKTSKIMEKIKKGEIVTHFEAKRIRKDGTEIYVSLTLSPIRNISEEITGTSTIARDITEQKK